jgi:hypothetical protein
VFSGSMCNFSFLFLPCLSTNINHPFSGFHSVNELVVLSTRRENSTRRFEQPVDFVSEQQQKVTREDGFCSEDVLWVTRRGKGHARWVGVLTTFDKRGLFVFVEGNQLDLLQHPRQGSTPSRNRSFDSSVRSRTHILWEPECWERKRIFFLSFSSRKILFCRLFWSPFFLSFGRPQRLSQIRGGPTGGKEIKCTTSKIILLISSRSSFFFSVIASFICFPLPPSFFGSQKKKKSNIVCATSLHSPCFFPDFATSLSALFCCLQSRIPNQALEHSAYSLFSLPPFFLLRLFSPLFVAAFP